MGHVCAGHSRSLFSNEWMIPELSLSSGVGSDLSIFCLTTVSINEVYIASNKTMGKEGMMWKVMRMDVKETR